MVRSTDRIGSKKSRRPSAASSCEARFTSRDSGRPRGILSEKLSSGTTSESTPERPNVLRIVTVANERHRADQGRQQVLLLKGLLFKDLLFKE